MNYYWLYYLATFFFAYAQQNPLLALVAIGFFAVRPWLPDPVVITRTLSRIGGLRRQVQLNAANVIARRDLAIAYLNLRLHKRALRYLDEARDRDPRNQEVAYLRGLALLRTGNHDAALHAFGQAVGVDVDAGEPLSSGTADQQERTFRRYAEAYLGAAEALERLGRLPQAEEALTMAASNNTSSLEPLVRLARVRRRQGKTSSASDALADARHTFAQLPGYAKRKQLGWWIRALVGA